MFALNGKLILMKLFMCLLGVLVSIPTLAQEQKKGKMVAIKLYNQTTFNVNLNNPSFYIKPVQNNVDIKFLQPTIAIAVENNVNNIHEFEITELNWTKNSGFFISNTEGYWTQIAIALRYEYKLMFNKKKTKNWQPSLGFAASPFYNRINFTPRKSVDYPIKQTNFGISAFVIPGINYKLSPKVFLDANVPICIAMASSYRKRVVNPSLPAIYQRESMFSYDGGIPKISFRIGLGVKL